MAKKPLAVIFDKAYFQKDFVLFKKVVKRFTHVVYEDAVCAKCPYLQDRHSYMCDACPAYIGEIRTYTQIKKHGIDFIGLPLGRKSEFLDYLKIEDWDQFDIKDRRYDTRFDYNITFGGKKGGELRDYQLNMATDFLKKKYGIIESPPRSGKTITALYIGIKYGRRMLVIANQKEFLYQFIEHINEFSNLPALEIKHKTKLFGIAKKYEDFEDYQIALATVQTFYSESGQKLLKSISKFYGNVWLDECFTYGHRVKTDKGLVTIGDIVTGKVVVSKVLSFNHSLSKDEYKPIVSVTQKKTKKLCRVMIDGEYFICTPNHEFYVVGKGYTKAEDLITGDDVQSFQRSV